MRYAVTATLGKLHPNTVTYLKRHRVQRFDCGPSFMRETLDEYEPEHGAWVCLLYRHGSRWPDAWALVYEGLAAFYVAPKYRRQGLGRELWRRVTLIFGKFQTSPHDEISTVFFDAVRKDRK